MSNVEAHTEEDIPVVFLHAVDRHYRQGDEVLDSTYGHGAIWTLRRPARLTGCDINPAKSPVGFSVDFRAMPWDDASYDAVFLDTN